MPRDRGSDSKDSASLLLSVCMLLMKQLHARMRHSKRPIEPAHAGLLGKISEGPCRISDLAEHQCVQVPTVSKSVSVLVERGLVHRWVPEENRRTTMVRLTKEGQKVIDALMLDAKRHTRALLGDLNSEEDKAVLEALQVLMQALGRNTRDEKEKGDQAAQLPIDKP